MAIPAFLSHLMIFLSLTTLPFYAASLDFNFLKMEESNNMLLAEGNTSYDSSGIILTPFQTDHIGRVSSVQPLQLWDDSTGTVVVADFTTQFSFTIYAQNRPTGDGIAFFLAAPPYEFPKQTNGAAIGLLSGELIESNTRPLVAVEFDTFNNSFDPKGLAEHVGINVNTMVSKAARGWSCNITTERVYNATISYDGKSGNLTVVYTGYEGNVPIVQRFSYWINLADALPRWVTVGFSAANGLFTSRHVLRSWSFSSSLKTGNDTPISPNPSPIPLQSGSSKTGLIVGLTVGSFALVTLLGLIALVLWRKRSRKEGFGDDLVFDSSMDNDFQRNTGAKRFTYNELQAATNNFADEEKLGIGGFGGVYRGFLKSMNSFVAIKKVSSVSNQGIKEYASEVKIISQLRHKNLVQLIGWCHRGKDLLLIYEFMPNGSLDSHLFKGKTLLPWAVRYNIARGLASALLYLHEEWEQCVLHRDIKASNVLLDSQFNAKLGDFGLARLVDHEKGSQTTALAGTLGYMAPECIISGRASRASDVYSFGVVAMELACGRKSIEPNAEESQVGLIEWVWSLYGTQSVLEAADPKLQGEFNEEQTERLMIVGLWCANPDPVSRPTMKQVIHVLDFQSSLPILPSDMPEITHLPRVDRHGKQSSQFSGTGASNFETGSETQSSSNYTISSQFSHSSGTNSPSVALLSTSQ